MVFKKRKLGRKITDLQVGDQHEMKAKVEDKDLLLYLGLTSDSNPLYIQHDYAAQTPFKRPLVPSVMLYGMVSSMVSLHLPGPGSHIVKESMSYPKPVYHYAEIHLEMTITNIDETGHCVTIDIKGTDEENDTVILGKLEVCPPYKLESLTAKSLENFN
ncbi:MaoC family dehydratase [Salinibacillus xinjiangensis]|uniref:Enoyl-CoA hydratase n=1 Tax=Salinibacillus xinjiangensis TaxID=1229268 RepID=A0A6G1X9V1_9BACI|nr:MaoC/PaaZ C-terminal domain-containing protein [Salinibacillus xinjiangensis]MRG87676.1 enoyl-CoA hydratase [Salinibacillus xinjiangensis]